MSVRYADGIAQVILEKVDILDVVQRYVPLKKAGRNHKGLCPFHHEKTPSFVVTEDRQRFHCFGCGESGDAIAFVMKMENLDFIDCIEFMADQYRVDLEPYKVEKHDPLRRELTDAILEINKTVAKGYYNTLKKEVGAREYLVSRRISPETLRRFGIGFAPDEWDFVLRNLGGRFTRKHLLEAGLIIKREQSEGYYDRFRNRIIFPIFDIRGRVIGFGGRVMDKSQPKYLNSPDTPVFNKSFHLYGMNFAKNHLGDEKRLIIVEGYMDVIALHDREIRNVAASLGTALTEGHGKLISRYAKEVVLLYDSDQAGVKATRRAIEVLGPFDLKLRVLSLPEGYDPDEYVHEKGREALLEAIDGAQDAIEYMLDFYRSDLNLKVKSEVIVYIDRAKEIFSVIRSPIEYAMYLDRIAAETGVDRALLARELKKPVARDPVKPVEEIDYRVTTAEYQLFRRLFEIFLHERRYFEEIRDTYGFEEIRHPIYRQLFRYVDEHHRIELTEAIDELPFEAVQFLEDLVRSPYEKPVQRGIREVSKLYDDVLIVDHLRILQKIKEEKERYLSNIEKDSEAYLSAEKRFMARHSEITSRMAEINKRRGQKGGE